MKDRTSESLKRTPTNEFLFVYLEKCSGVLELEGKNTSFDSSNVQILWVALVSERRAHHIISLEVGRNKITLEGTFNGGNDVTKWRLLLHEEHSIRTHAELGLNLRSALKWFDMVVKDKRKDL